MDVAAIIFDFDGLIVDTESPILDSWQEVFRDHGLELSLEDWARALGTHGGYDPCAHLAELTGLTFDHEALRNRVRARNQIACEGKPLLPGVVDRLEEAKSLGLRTAVASSSSRAWVEGWLSRHAIRHRIDEICARDDVKRVKPAPDLFLLAAARLGVEPAACLVFEDSPNGILAARHAGMRCVAVPNVVTAQLTLPESDLVLSSLAEKTLAEVLSALPKLPAVRLEE